MSDVASRMRILVIDDHPLLGEGVTALVNCKGRQIKVPAPWCFRRGNHASTRVNWRWRRFDDLPLCERLSADACGETVVKPFSQRRPARRSFAAAANSSREALPDTRLFW